jgi:spindle and centriole-associated protein 1
MHAASKQKTNMLSSSTASADRPSSTGSSLDVLKHVIHEVEHEMEEYERCTGREVTGLQGGQGLTGFTLSLVSSLCRLVRYLKEVRVQVMGILFSGKNICRLVSPCLIYCNL